jgi:HEAT repeat protein
MRNFFINRQLNSVLFGLLAMALLISGCHSDAKVGDISSQLETAQSGTGQERFAAIDHLGDRQDEAAAVVPVLLKLLNDPNAQVRWHAERSIGDFGDKAQAAVPDLLKQLAGDDPTDTYHAAIALGKIGDKSEATVDALATAVMNKNPHVARAAIAALRHLRPGPQKMSAAVERALENDDTAVEVYAIEALVEHGKEAVPLLNALLKRPRTSLIACAAIEQIGPDASETVPGLIDLLSETKHSQLQIQALLSLARIGAAAEPAVPTILAVAEKTQDATVPVAAAFALGSIGTKDAKADASLRTALAKDNAFLQMVAAWALAKTHPDDAALKQQALDKLTAGAKSSDEAIRSAAEKGLKSLAPAADEPAAAQ